MILDFLVKLSSMFSSTPGIAVTGSFLWGIAGIILSPCHLAGIPLIVGYIDSQGEIPSSRAVIISTLFSSGILLTIVIIGLITGLTGRILGDIGQFGNILVSFLMIIIGLYMTGIIHISLIERGINQPKLKKKDLPAAFFLGVFFGVALGPCTFAYMAPMLGVAFSVATSRPFFAVAIASAYAAGHCMVIIMAGSSANIVKSLLKWNEESRGPVYLKKICGILVVAAGIYILTFAF